MRGIKHPLSFVFGALLWASCCGYAADDGVRAYTVLSLIGDKMTMAVHTRTVGSSLDKNRHEAIGLNDDTFDKTALIAASEAIKRFDASASTRLLATDDPKLYELSDKMLDQTEQPTALLAAISQLNRDKRATYLILITKYRADARLRWDRGTTGSGKIEGLGFYMDPSIYVQRSDTGERGKGFLAPFVYIKVALVDGNTMAVIRQETITESSMFSYAGSTGDADLWNTITSEQKVAALQEIIRGGIARAIPDLLRAR